MKTSERQFEVFYDGKCPLCCREIDWISKRKHFNRLILSDVSSINIDFECLGKTRDELLREIHGRFIDSNDDGPDNVGRSEWVIGADVFRHMYRYAGLKSVTAVSSVPLIRPIVNQAYRLFAKWRYGRAIRRYESDSRCAIASQGIESEVSL